MRHLCVSRLYLLIALGNVLLPALAAVIVNHAETHTPLVLEGGFILPALVAHPTIAPLYAAGQVRAVVVHEAEEAQFLTNFLHREPGDGPQHLRALVSGTMPHPCAARAPVGNRI
jgi:hypothetical protein